MTVNWAAVAIGAIIIGGVAVTFMKPGSQSSRDEALATQRAQILAPQNLSLTEQKGQVAFNENCAVCHGENAGGTEQGPPFVHNTYNPGHHSDETFFLAAKRGVRAHHWPYGNMPPQPQVTASEVAAIIAYVRAAQAANGIITRPHTME